MHYTFFPIWFSNAQYLFSGERQMKVAKARKLMYMMASKKIYKIVVQM